jgi:hypothetical protein
MICYGYGDYEIDRKEIPVCKKMFLEKFPDSRLIRSYFSESNTTSERYYNIEMEHKNGDRETCKFCLGFIEEENAIEVLMLNYFYEEISCKEIARG